MKERSFDIPYLTRKHLDLFDAYLVKNVKPKYISPSGSGFRDGKAIARCFQRWLKLHGLPKNQVTCYQRIRRIKIKDVVIPKTFRADLNIKPLVASIKEHGLLNPIHVNDRRVVISGTRRVAAMKFLGYKTIPYFEVLE